MFYGGDGQGASDEVWEFEDAAAARVTIKIKLWNQKPGTKL